MTSKLTFMKFYPGDFFNDKKVRSLRDVPGCAAAYLALLMLLWMDGGETPDNDTEIAHQLQLDEVMWKHLRAVLIARGLIGSMTDEETGEQVIFQPRIARDLAAAAAVAERRAGGAEKSRAKKEAKAKQKLKKSPPPLKPNTGDQKKRAADIQPADDQNRTSPIQNQNQSHIEEPSPETLVAVERGFGGEKNATDKKANTDQALKPKTLSDIANMIRDSG